MLGAHRHLWLNPVVPRHPKYRLPDSRQGHGGPLYWVSSLLLLGAVGWFWWQSGRTKSPEAPPQPAPAAPTAKLVAPPPSNTISLAFTAPPPAKVIAPLPPAQATGFPRAARDVFEAQVALARNGISSGSLDGSL